MSARKEDIKEYALALFKRLKELNYTFACELYTEKCNGVSTNTGTIKFIIETSRLNYYAMVTIGNVKFHQRFSVKEKPEWKDYFCTDITFHGEEWNDKGSTDRYFFRGASKLDISKLRFEDSKLFSGTDDSVIVPDIFISFNFVERMVTEYVTH